MAVPILIFVLALATGGLVAARWLPDLGTTRIGATAFWVTCCLAGIALALAAVHVYEIARQLDSANVGGIGNAKADIVAEGIIDTLRDVGPILGLCAAVYLLVPGATTSRTPNSHAAKAE